MLLVVLRLLRWNLCFCSQVNYGGVATKNSPYRVYTAQPLNPAAVRVFGPGVEAGVKTNSPTHFNIDCRDAGEGKDKDHHHLSAMD